MLAFQALVDGVELHGERGAVVAINTTLEIPVVVAALAPKRVVRAVGRDDLDRPVFDAHLANEQALAAFDVFVLRQLRRPRPRRSRLLAGRVCGAFVRCFDELVRRRRRRDDLLLDRHVRHQRLRRAQVVVLRVH